MSVIAASSSSRSFNVLTVAPIDTSPIGSSTAGGGLEVATSLSILATGYCSGASTSMLSTFVTTSAKGPSGGDEGAGLGA